MRLHTALYTAAIVLPIALFPSHAPAAKSKQATTAASAKAAKSSKPSAKASSAKASAKTPAGKKAKGPPQSTLTEAQLSMATQVQTGRAQCEFNETVLVEPHATQVGAFRVRFQSTSYTMVPEETSTGAVRLLDRKAGVVWLQIPVKSMLMDNRAGRRLIDACTQPAQRMAQAEATAKAAAVLAVAEAASAAQAAASANAALAVATAASAAEPASAASATSVTASVTASASAASATTAATVPTFDTQAMEPGPPGPAVTSAPSTSGAAPTSTSSWPFGWGRPSLAYPQTAASAAAAASAASAPATPASAPRKWFWQR